MGSLPAPPPAAAPPCPRSHAEASGPGCAGSPGGVARAPCTRAEASAGAAASRIAASATIRRRFFLAVGNCSAARLQPRLYVFGSPQWPARARRRTGAAGRAAARAGGRSRMVLFARRRMAAKSSTVSSGRMPCGGVVALAMAHLLARFPSAGPAAVVARQPALPGRPASRRRQRDARAVAACPRACRPAARAKARASGY